VPAMRRILSFVLVLCALSAPSTASAQPPVDPGADPAAADPGAEPAAAPTEAAEPAAAPTEGVDPAAPETAGEATDGEMTPEQRAEYAAALRQFVQEIRARVLGKITAKIQAKQEEKLDRMAAIISVLALSGVFLLFMPFHLRRRYPGRMGHHFKYSALAALLFFLTVVLFSFVLFAMRGAQTALGEYTNPQVRLVSSTFDLIENKAEDMAEVGPLLIEPTLQSLNEETDSPVLVIMLENIQKLKNDVSVFTSVGRFVKKLDWLFGMLPILFTGLAMILFARMAWPTLAEIIRLPESAAEGRRGAVGHAVRLTLRSVWAEAKATLCVVGVLLALTLLAAFLLGFVLEPAIEIFMAYLAVAFLYIQVDANASSFWILFSLMGSVLFLVLNLAVIVLTTLFFLAKSQKILQGRFRKGVPLGIHRRFWRWGTLGAIWAQLLPVLYIAVAVKAIGWFVEKSAERFLDPQNPADSNWPFVLASGPALFLVTFLLIFWIGRGVSALRFLATYKVEGEAYAAVVVAEDTFARSPGA
jgi:hypothetical protein